MGRIDSRIFLMGMRLKFEVVFIVLYMFVGKEIEVLFDRKGRYENQYIGRSIYNQSVFINSNSDIIGKLFNTKINRSTDFALEAVL